MVLGIIFSHSLGDALTLTSSGEKKFETDFLHECLKVVYYFTRKNKCAFEF
jgi:hypothetical protein